jgi:hypothetical protein
VSNSKVPFCSHCCKAKSHKLPFYPSSSSATVPLQVIHTDLWGPSPVLSNKGNKYYILFTDEFSHFSWIYCCSCKSDVPKLFTQFKTRVENLLCQKTRTLQCDGGTEFKPIMQMYPEITFQVSCPYTPEQNGLAERKHRHIVELRLATMFNASIPLIYWDQIFESIIFYHKPTS